MDREYTGLHIDYPRFVEYMKYRRDNPPPSVYLKGILVYLGAIKPEAEATEDASCLNSVAGTVKLDDETFNKKLDFIRRKRNYL